ncbi:MAG: hypothetical protein NTW20_04035 [Rhodobacterales bacterium]|nr:hypothetical protein [Rhodobacterales bacterium]
MARRKDPETASDGAGPPEHLSGQADGDAETVTGPMGERPSEAATEASFTPVTPPLPPASRRSGVLGPILGGALATAVGFGLSHFNVLGFAAPDQTVNVAALEQRLASSLADGLAKVELRQEDIAALGADLATLTDRLATVEAIAATEPPDLSRLDGLDARLAAIEALPADGQASTAALAAKLAELERRLNAQPVAVDQGKIDAALARLEAAETEAEKRAADAVAAASAAAKGAALDRLRKAVASGGAFEADLAAVADPALSEALQPHAAGVATLSALQAEFPEAARQTLKLARDAAGDQGWGARLVDFLAAQTGARSLTPREGDAPDAVLSRSEFALGEGRLADALAELGTLDPALQAPFQDWIVRASARLSVDQALAAAKEAR